jgi:hypothetical protein
MEAFAKTPKLAKPIGFTPLTVKIIKSISIINIVKWGKMLLRQAHSMGKPV